VTKILLVKGPLFFLVLVTVCGLSALISNNPVSASGEGSNSWSKYLDLSIGRTCTLASKGKIDGVVVSSTDSQTLLSVKPKKSGELLEIRVRTVATVAGIAPIVSQSVVPYQLLDDGALGVAPDLGTNSSFNLTFTGNELYPAISALHEGASIMSRFSGTLSGATAASSSALKKMVTSGKKLNVSFVIRVSSAPTLKVIKTPAGTYRKLVGVVVRVVSAKALNARPADKSMLSGVVKAPPSVLYFAKGVGMVKGISSGVTFLLSRCGN
jgi:hypothetical protein